MRGWALRLLLVASTATAADLAFAASALAQQKVARGIPIAADASIRIHNLYGPTRLIGWEFDSIAVTGTVQPGGGFYLGGGGQLAKLGIERKSDLLKGPLDELEIRVPRGARIWIKGAVSDITVSDFAGELDLATVGGAIRLTGPVRQVTAESLEGPIEINGRALLVRVRSGGGRIVLRDPAGDVSAVTVSGAIVVSGAALTLGRLETVSGAVSYDGTVDPKGRLDVQTHSGNIELMLPAGFAGEFVLHSLEGPVFTAFLTKAGKSVKGKPVEFLTGPGAHVAIRSFKGAITVDRR